MNVKKSNYEKKKNDTYDQYKDDEKIDDIFQDIELEDRSVIEL